MSYLFPIADTAGFGVVEVGSNILVANGIISIQQSVANTANVTFANISDSSLTSGRVTFAGANGLLIDNGNLTFNSTTNTLSSPNASFTSANITNGTFSNAAVSGNLTLNGNSVVTSVTPNNGPGISLSNVTTSGPNSVFTVNNTGVISLIAGTGITVSGANGNVTVSATGATVINTKGVSANYTLTNLDDYVGATTGSITLTLPAGVTGQSFILKNEGGSGACTVACTGSDTIDGSSTKSMNSNASITVVFRAGAWRII